jgi:NAD(P)-dependent dehydrogenase (short-subunit alcohol dehydrogenase family)
MEFIMNRIAGLLISLFASLIFCFSAVAAGEEQHTVLITGANRGIGFEFVRQFTDKGYRVIATCRNPDGAEALNEYAKEHDNIVVERLDLLDLPGIDALGEKYAGQPIDIVINNAALMRGPDKGQSFGTMDYEEFDTFFDINVKGPLKVSEVFWPHVMASDKKMMASLTTGQGWKGIPVPGFTYYKSSKAAIDNIYMDVGRQGRRDEVRVVTLMPGRVATHGEKQTKGMVPIETSISGMIEVMEDHTLKQNGKSFWWNGSESK